VLARMRIRNRDPIAELMAGERSGEHEWHRK
jgi:hypothetical protein